jgi:hypothetical protein
VPFPPWTRILEAYALPFASDPFVGKAPARWLVVGGVWTWLASCLSLASVNLVGARPLSVKQPLEGSCRLCRLWLSSVESPAGYWCSQPFGQSHSSGLSTMEILGTPADRQRCPWPTVEVIPTTLAPETGEVSWVSMGLWRVPFLTEVSTLPSKSQDSLSSLEVVDLEVKFRGVSPAISGHAGSGSDPAMSCSTAVCRCPFPRNLGRFGF